MARPVLTRFDTQVLRDKDVTDKAQVPAEGATINFYRQGATATASEFFLHNETKTVPIFDPGTLKDGDSVQFSPTGAILTVVGPPSPTAVVLKNGPFGLATLAAYGRILQTVDRPAFSSTPTGLLGPSQTSTGPDGRASGYITHPLYDYVVSGGGLSSNRYHIDARGGWRPNPSWLNARDFPGIQEAVNALPPTGGEVFIPAGTWVLPAGLTINTQNVTLRGDGPYATILTRNPATLFDLVSVNRAAFKLYDLQIDGAATSPSVPNPPATYSCLLLNGPDFNGGHFVGQCFLENVILRRAPQTGLTMRGIIFTVLINVRCESNQRNGARVDGGSTTIRFIRCAFSDNGPTSGPIGPAAGIGLELNNAVSIMLLGCSLENNRGGLQFNEGNALDVRNLSQVRAIGCRFARSLASNPPEQFFYSNLARSPIVENCSFDGGSASPPARAARFEDTSWAQFSGNIVKNVADPVSGVVDFTGTTNDAMEFGNIDLDASPPRIRVAPGLRVFGLSKGVVELYRRDTNPDTDTLGMQEGAIIWENGTPALRVLKKVSVDPAPVEYRWKRVQTA